MTRRIALALGLACFCAVAGAQSGIEASRRTAIVRAIERAAPAVVSINVTATRLERLAPRVPGFFDFFDMPDPYLRRREQPVNAAGSGFIIDEAGHVVTNYHVIEDTRVRSVTLPGGREVAATLVGVDRRTDLAVLKAEAAGLPQLTLGSSEDLLIGEWVIALGNPFATLIEDAHPSVSVGVISAVERRLSARIGEGARLYQGMIQTDAAINPGNSGGPLVNALGKVVGVNTMIFSPSGGNIGLGFAIPIARVRRVVNEIIRYGRRRDPWPGFVAEDVVDLHPRHLRELGVRAEEGCVVVRILTEAPAYREGLRPGDVVTAFDGQPISRALDIDFAVWDHFVGDKVTLTFERDGAPRRIRFEIVELAD